MAVATINGIGSVRLIKFLNGTARRAGGCQFRIAARPARIHQERKMIGRILATCGGLMLATGAFAQSATHGGSHNPAIKDSHAAMVQAPAAGANSFSKDQARGRFAKAGYGSISALAKDKDGIWRGRANHHGKMINVSLDYKGNVTAR
jgi:hypothetical protein